MREENISNLQDEYCGVEKAGDNQVNRSSSRSSSLRDIDGRKLTEKNKEGSNRMVDEPDRMIHDYIKFNKQKYLNISVGLDEGARVAEWLLRLSDTRWPLWFVGSIPAPGVSLSLFNNFLGVNH